MADRHLNMRADRAFIESCEPADLRSLMFLGIDPARHSVLLTNWSGFDVYGVTFDGHRPAFFCPTPTPDSFRLPWIGVVVKGFEESGYLCTISVPEPVAGVLRRPEGRAVVHRFAEPGDVVPPLARSMRTLV
ncbi:hypothetical protein JOF56_006831 [Kibdelosporangium banguiense]|uniref:Uncharacterized protein n=1 Tax=Kibdelosporangium banguiense TaxID=1365924 RepID=A0ABS4TPW1_9PSEU|nr:hypothetical protein [Kibdelosporangium banguiense]MBP2326446.1 hypothetical protein [Kibdelosporangium banguiense]